MYVFTYGMHLTIYEYDNDIKNMCMYVSFRFEYRLPVPEHRN